MSHIDLYKTEFKCPKCNKLFKFNLQKRHIRMTKYLICNSCRLRGENNPMYGKRHSIATKQLISKNRIGKFIGPRNNMYGKSMRQYCSEEEWIERYKRHSILMTGKNNPMSKYEYRIKTHKHYFYDKRFFSSSPELALYIWLKDNNIKFEYQPNVDLEYEVDGKIHHYQPDFLIGKDLVEIKGDQFLNSDGTWKNPYDNKLNYIYEAKHQCALKNNVKIFYEKQYKKYIDYIKFKYGKDFLKQFEIHHDKN